MSKRHIIIRKSSNKIFLSMIFVYTIFEILKVYKLVVFFSIKIIINNKRRIKFDIYIIYVYYGRVWRPSTRIVERKVFLKNVK